MGLLTSKFNFDIFFLPNKNLIKHKGKTFLVGNIYGNPHSDDAQSMNTITSITQHIIDIQTNFQP